MKIEESRNVTFDEILPEPNSSSSVEDDRIDEPIVQDLNRSPSLQVNVSDEGYPKSLKEARGHPIEQVIGELNQRTLRAFLKLCIVEDPIWEKISQELDEPIRSTHIDECVCCQVQHMTEESMYALHKEMSFFKTLMKNELRKTMSLVIDPLNDSSIARITVA
ncbi:hypothetical protein Tco_1507422 [Tanacetum coccineum]